MYIYCSKLEILFDGAVLFMSCRNFMYCTKLMQGMGLTFRALRTVMVWHVICLTKMNRSCSLHDALFWKIASRWLGWG
jgi:hypothetical protein